MVSLTGRPVTPKPPKPERGTKAAKAHIAAVKAMPCAVCGAPPPSDAHHCFHDRYGSRRASDFEVIPLCKAHHQDGPLAIHNAKAAWRAAYGPDYRYLPRVWRMIERMAR